MVTTLKSPSPILVSPLVPKVVIAIGGVVVSAFSGILFNLSTVTVVVNILRGLIGVLRWTYNWARYIDREG